MSKAAIKRIMQKDIKVVGVHKLNDMGIYLEFNEENVMEAVAMIIAPKDSVYKNGILFFDEYDKVSSNKSIMSTLLHITDFGQNHEFVDNYLADLKIDLSSINASVLKCILSINLWPNELDFPQS